MKISSIDAISSSLNKIYSLADVLSIASTGDSLISSNTLEFYSEQIRSLAKDAIDVLEDGRADNSQEE